MRWFRPQAVVLAVIALGFGIGCSGDKRPRIAKAQGVVLIDGQPAKDIAVRFHPAEGRVSMALTDDEGNFVLTTQALGDGAVVGEHQVALVHADPNRPITQSNAEFLAKSPISIKYGDPETSGITATVEPGKVNTYRFELPGKNR